MPHTKGSPQIQTEGPEKQETLCGDVALKIQRKPMKPRSEVWEHFARFNDNGVIKGKCHYRSRDICCDSIKNGTSGLKSHISSCKKFPANLDMKQKELSLQQLKDNEDLGHLSNWKFDKNVIREAIVQMIIVDELPFKFVESQGFKKVISVACPKFKLPSRWTISRDCLDLYTSEKLKLKSFLRNSTQRVCITTDTWTSLQRVNFMCITAHFIDHDWKLHKKILNFCPISSHKGESIGRLLVDCLLECGLKDVFTVTVDNASSNDVAIAYLKKKIISWGTSVLSCKFLHMRCIAHILNLVVQDGLKDVNQSVCWIRKAIKYIRQSPSKLQNFKKCAEECNLSTKASLCLDVATRWNSTFKMLSVAEKYEGAFELYNTQDPGFRHEVEFEHDIESEENDKNNIFIDWVAIRKMSHMLQNFYETTVRVSGSCYITANTFWTEIGDLLGLILKWTESDDLEIKSMGMRMKIKFDKYWGDHTKMNKLIFIATVFDPREKFEVMKFAFCQLYGLQNGEELFKGVKECLCDLFDEYKRTIQHKDVCISHCDVDSSNNFLQCPTDITGTKRKSKGVFKEEYLKQKLKIDGAKKVTELDIYLNEALIEDHEDFDILRWWRLKNERFPVLSRIARDILAVPISTVASESAFSTGGRVLDAFRSSLTPKMVEALICSQDWLRDDLRFNVEDALEESEDFENGLQNIESQLDIEFRSTNLTSLDTI